jgi:phosphoglycerate dehydrogenase-like enzyme
LPHSVAVSRHGAGLGPDNIWTIQLISDAGAAVLVFGFAAGRRVERYEWIGAGYDVVLDMPEQGEWSQQGRDPEIFRAADLTGATDYHINYGFVNEYQAFADAIDGRGERPRADFLYAAAFMEVVQTILNSQPGQMYSLSRTTETVAAPVTPVKAPAATAHTGGIVQFLQPVGAQGTYFTVEQFTQLARHGTVRRDGNVPALDDVNALVLGWGAPAVTAEQLALAKRLQLVVVLGASVQWAVPLPLLLERGVTVCNTADAIAQSVAEHCLLLTLAGLRRLTEVDHGMRRGDWPPRSLRPFSAANLIKLARNFPLINVLKPLLRPMASGVLAKAGSNGAAKWNDLRGQVVGLIGWGHIARHYAKLLQPFGCRLLVCSEHVAPAELEEFHATPASLGEVLGGAKVISLHKGLTDQSKGLLDESALALIPRGAVLVNTARAGLIDEAALIARARKGDVVFALDVFHQEPLPRKHPLRALENVILSPHNASSTPQCNQRVGAAAIQIVEDWLAGRPVPALNAAKLATMT